ncbi:MAG: hypothetical protein AB7O88_00640 [Reyranellaceae bacterium]
MAKPPAAPKRRYSRRVALTPERLAKFLGALAASGNVRASAEAAGITPKAAYQAKAKDERLAEAWDDARDTYAASLERELNERVFKGLRRPVFQGGKLVGHETLKSDALLLAALRANMPEKYSDKLDARHHVSGGVLIVPGVAQDAAGWEKSVDADQAEWRKGSIGPDDGDYVDVSVTPAAEPEAEAPHGDSPGAEGEAGPAPAPVEAKRRIVRGIRLGPVPPLSRGLLRR